MKHLPIIIALCFCFPLTAQDMITNYESTGSNSKHYLEEFEGKYYLISLRQDDVVEVFQLLSPTEKELLYQQKFTGIFENKDISVAENYLCFGSAGAVYSYDFVNDITREFEVPEGYYFRSFRESYGGKYLSTGLRIDNLNIGPILLFHVENGFSEYELETTGYFLDDLHVMSLSTDGKRTYVIHDFEGTHYDTLAKDLDFYQLMDRQDSLVFYLDEGLKLNHYNLITKEKTVYPDIWATYARNYSVHREGENIILISMDSEMNWVKTYNLESQQLVSEIELETNSHIHYSMTRVVGDVICALVRTEIVLINYQTSEVLVRPTYYDWVSPYKILEEKYIISPMYDFYMQENFELIDITDFSVIPLQGNFSVYVPRTNGFAKFNQTYVGAFNYQFPEYYPMFNFDLENYTAEKNTILDKTNNGFKEESVVVKLDDEIFLLADEFYEVNNTQVEQINTFPISEVQYEDYLIENNTLYFYSDSSKIIYSYKNGELKEEASLENLTGPYGLTIYLKEYAVTDDYVFVMDGFDFHLTKVDKNTNETTLESELGFSGNIINRLRSFNNYVYYPAEGNLYRSNGNDEPELVAPNFYSSFLDEDFLLFKDELHFLTNAGLSKINKDNELEFVGDLDIFPVYFELFVTDKSSNHIIIGGEEPVKYHYDGESLFQFTLTTGNTNQTYPSNNGIFFFQEHAGNGEVQWSYYNSEKKLYDIMPAELDKQRMIDYFESNGNGYLLTSQGFNPNDIMRIYKTDDTFSFLELQSEYYDVGYLYESSSTLFYDEGWLFAGDIIFLMNEDQEFIPLENIKGSPTNPEVVEKDGEVYFLAMDRDAGRQLFKTTLISFRTDTDELPLKTDVNIYPNPTDQALTIQSHDGVLEFNKIMLHDSQGRTLLSQMVDNARHPVQIDLAGLAEGIYFLTLQNNKQKLTKRIIISRP